MAIAKIRLYCILKQPYFQNGILRMVQSAFYTFHFNKMGAMESRGLKIDSESYTSEWTIINFT